MQTITVTGSIGKDAELRNAGNSEVCSFSLASSQGFGDKKQTNWFRVQIWGKRGVSLQPYLLKGGKVAVSGELELREWDGKMQLEIRANEVDLMGGKAERQERPAPKQESRGNFADIGEDFDAPF
jgi:single-strand DNA-binding protein